METRLGHSFADVRVHADGSPARYGADAFASGDRLHFSRGAYRPHTESGRHLIRHELAHVVQQRAGRVRPTAPGAPVNADPRLEAEADAVAEGGASAFTRAFAPSISGASASSAYGGRGGDAAATVVQCGKEYRETRSKSQRKVIEKARARIDAKNIQQPNFKRKRKGVNRLGVGDGTAYGQGGFAHYAGVPTKNINRAFSKAERAKVNKLGKSYGCHSCGDKTPASFVPDHQPPLALFQQEKGSLANYSGHLFPHCSGCSSKQGGAIAKKLKNG